MATYMWLGGSLVYPGLGRYDTASDWYDVTNGVTGDAYPQAGDTAEVVGNAISGVTLSGSIITFPLGGGFPQIYVFPEESQNVLLTDPNAIVGYTVADQTIDLTGVAGPISVWLENSTLTSDTIVATGTTQISAYLDDHIDGTPGQSAWVQLELLGVDTSGVGPTDHVPTTTLDSGTTLTIAQASTFDVESLSDEEPPVNLAMDGTVQVSAGGTLILNNSDAFFNVTSPDAGVGTQADLLGTTITNDGIISLAGASGAQTGAYLIANVNGTGTIEVAGNGAPNSATLLVVDAELDGQTIELSDGTVRVNDANTANGDPGQAGFNVSGGAFVFEDANGRLELHQPPLTTLGVDGQGNFVQVPDGRMPFTAQISGFQLGDTIDLVNKAITGNTYYVDYTAATGVLNVDSPASIQGNPPAVEASLTLDGNYNPSLFQLTTNDTTGELDLLYNGPPCFVEGTRIATAHGEIPVEELRVGDRVRIATAPGTTERVTWIGMRRVDCERHPSPRDVWPIRIAADALEPGQPARDVLLSPEHGVYVDGVLVPAQFLVNGGSIAQKRRPLVAYYHVELATHAVLLADGLPAESWLDTGNRRMFANAPPTVPTSAANAERIWAERACAKLLRSGSQLDAIRQRLAARSVALGRPVHSGIEIWIAQTGMREIDLPAGVSTLRLRSDNARAPGDARRLGVLLSGVTIDGVVADKSMFGPGFHRPERRDDALPRWTDGDATLVLDASRHARKLTLFVAGVAARPSRARAA